MWSGIPRPIHMAIHSLSSLAPRFTQFKAKFGKEWALSLAPKTRWPEQVLIGASKNNQWNMIHKYICLFICLFIYMP